jgi:hypothetical protein
LPAESDISYADFLDDTKTQDALVRNLEVISEAVKNISADFKERHKAVDWTALARMRDKLIHHYFGVNLVIVWDVVKQKVPDLQHQIEETLRDTDGS